MRVQSRDWELKKENEKLGIKVYTRAVEGSDLKEFRGEMEIKSTLTAPLALIEDVPRATEWMHNCGKLEMLENTNPGEAVSYMITVTPWPVTDRDTVVHTVASQDQESLAVRVDINAKNNVLPEEDDYIRITTMSGFWSFTPTSDQNIKVVYQVHGEPNGSLPSWLANSIVVDTPYNTLKNMKKLLKEDKYQTAALSYITNR